MNGDRNLPNDLKRVRNPITRMLSAPLRDHHAFIVLVTAVAVLKLILAWIEPASYDMYLTVLLIVNNRNPLVGPWIALYPPLFLGMVSSTQLGLQQWYLASPLSTNSGLQLISFLLRLPILLFDVATMGVLFYVGKKIATADVGRLAGLLWFLNPFTLFSVELIGVPDVVVVFLLLAAFILLLSRHTLFSSIFLALGTCLKLYPAFLIPPFLLYAHLKGSTVRDKLGMLGLGMVGLVGYLSWVSRFDVLYLFRYSPVTQPLPFISGESVVDASAFGLIVFYCLLGLFAKKSGSLISMLISTLLIYYMVSNPSPQYLIWVMPFMALDLALSRDRFKVTLFAVFYALAFAQWFFNSSAFLTPSRYSLLLIPFEGNLPWYSQAIANFLDWSKLKLVGVLLLPMLASGFYACTFIYALEEARSWFGASTHSQ